MLILQIWFARQYPFTEYWLIQKIVLKNKKKKEENYSQE